MAKVFISWSGESSKRLANAIASWLPSVIQAAEPFISSDIEPGTSWSASIGSELEAKVGLVCLTRENLDSPWILFEAGALFKGLSEARVCALLFDLQPTDVSNPLALFQNAPYCRDEMERVVAMVNSQCAIPLGESLLQRSFDRCWPELDTDIQEILKSGQSETIDNPRSERDLLEEIVTYVREADRRARRAVGPVRALPPGYAAALRRATADLGELLAGDENADIHASFAELQRVVMRIWRFARVRRQQDQIDYFVRSALAQPKAEDEDD